jgi:threonine dehydratase
MRCAGCGAEPADAYPFRCPRADAGDDRDHVLVPAEDGRGAAIAETRGAPLASDPAARHPFVRYRRHLWVYTLARRWGVSDAAYVDRVMRLDRAIAAVDGHGLESTPIAPAAALAAGTGLSAGRVWVKDETGQVAGSHKARHLFGIALALEALEHAGIASRADSDRRGLAIASCGNAALAAAVIACATRRPLVAFIPPEASPVIVARLAELGARTVVCTRAPGERGDPCLARFHDALRRGSIPFCCQGSENGLAIEGGMTLAWELIEAVANEGGTLDRLFVQVGGGALASACVGAMRHAVAAGLVRRAPRFHAIQPERNAPLGRAYARLRARILDGVDAIDPDAGDDAVADAMRAPALAHRVGDALRYARAHRSEFMWPWEAPERSIAEGILDDETYDWYAVVEGMIETGGWPITVPEQLLREAHELARAATRIPVDPTGSAGLAGLLALRRRGAIVPDESAAVLFTGRERQTASRGQAAEPRLPGSASRH